MKDLTNNQELLEKVVDAIGGGRKWRRDYEDASLILRIVQTHLEENNE